jgi:transcriptional regulator with XRE-family HTH domain
MSLFLMATREAGRPPIHEEKPSSFGDWLKYERARRAMSGEQLAFLLETSQSMVSMYERGGRSPKRDTVIRFAEALAGDTDDATVTALVNAGLRAAGFLPDGENAPSLTVRESQILAIYSSSPEPVKVTIEEFLRIVAKSERINSVEDFFREPHGDGKEEDVDNT